MMLNYLLPEIEFSTKKEKLKYFVDREEKIKQMKFNIEYDYTKPEGYEETDDVVGEI